MFEQILYYCMEVHGALFEQLMREEHINVLQGDVPNQFSFINENTLLGTILFLVVRLKFSFIFFLPYET